MASDAVPQSTTAAAPAHPKIFRTLPGRLFLLSVASLVVVWVVQQAMPLPAPVEAFRKVVSFFSRVAALWLLVLVVIRHRREFLWRVRRKLILSYVFLGFVPVVLIVLFGLAGGFVLHANVAGYLFREGLDDLVEIVHQVAATSATEIGTVPIESEVVIARKYALMVTRYRGLSLAVVPVDDTGAGPLAVAGAWRHLAPPSTVPSWAAAQDFSGILAMVLGNGNGTPDHERLLIRSVVPLPDGRHAVIADLPVDTDVAALLDEQTGARIVGLELNTQGNEAQPLTGRAPPVPQRDNGAAETDEWVGLFRRTVVFMDFRDWDTGNSGRVSVGIDAPLGRLYARMSSAGGVAGGSALLTVLVAIGVLLLIVQGVALFFGAGLGRQITSAVHELFIGTERVQQGDFTHRIAIESRDQLGALAGSFNRMSASIEHLLHVQREKQRLDDELRIAREIQQSLLPDRPPVFAGLSIADLCVPAREVGGDYYDFFILGPRQLGLLIADVSGKGTSAALYMAELKGLMLALSHAERSPKRLLTHVNHLLADHLDNRSFITMTYAVIDLDARTLTHARAGHTPLIVASGLADGATEVIVPNGMVLGLRLPGAEERFNELLEEHTRPLHPGDVIVFYTDGITEAMNVDDDLFTDAALGRVVSSHRTLDAAGIRERVLRDVRAFVGDAEPHDDMTMVVVKIEES